MRKNSRSFGVGECTSPRSLLHGSSPDVLSEPDDSYPNREQKKTRKARDTNASGRIGAFFSRPAALAVDPEDVVMNEGETASINEEPDA